MEGTGHSLQRGMKNALNSDLFLSQDLAAVRPVYFNQECDLEKVWLTSELLIIPFDG